MCGKWGGKRILARDKTWRQWAKALKQNIYALYLAARDPRVPLPAKLLIGGVVAYALSPIDLIPDFIPVLGYLDDMLLLPLGIWLAIRLVPADVWRECREQAARYPIQLAPNRAAALGIGIIWALAMVGVAWWIWADWKP